MTTVNSTARSILRAYHEIEHRRTNWIASAELVDAIPADDLHGPTYDELLRGAAEASYEAERGLRFKDGDWTPESYTPHRAALNRYYELYKLGNHAAFRVIETAAVR